MYERVLPFAQLYNFNSNQVFVDTSNKEHFMQAYFELYDAAFQPFAKLPFDSDSLKLLISGNNSVIDIGILHYKFNSFDSATVAQKLYFGTDSVLFENTSIPTSLYVERIAFVASPLRETIEMGTVIFRFRNMLRFDNTGNPIVSLKIDFDDGNGTQQITDSLVSVIYTMFGIKTLRFEAILNNGDTLIAYSTIDCTPPPPMYAPPQSKWPYMRYYDGVSVGSDPDHFPSIKAKITTQHAYNGMFSEPRGEVWIYYANSDRELRKPVLIVDGFDPTNDRTFEDHKNAKDGGKSIWQMIGNGVDSNVGLQLLVRGYDLVVLDLPEGGIYIEQNAMVCIETINEINRMLAYNNRQEQIVVVGPSMGGQITRYALTYMETHSNANTNYGNHNCRLWISFDSPHQGANISIGAQALIEYFSKIGSVKKIWENTLCCKAAKQMLIHHKEDDAKSIHTAYYDGVRALNPITGGHPANLRKVAIANGSLNNISNGVADEIAFEGVLWWSFFATPVVPAVPLLNFIPPLPLLVDVRVRNAPNAGKKIVFSANYYLGAIPIPITYKFDNNTGKCSHDAAPGCWYPTYEILAEKLKDAGASIKTNKEKHCFMSIPSVLDISGDMNYCTDFSSTNLVTQGKTPFQSYWGPTGENMEHISFDNSLVDWVLNEIETYIEPGARKIPLCEEKNYTLHLPAGKSSGITWTCSPNLQIVSGGNAKTVTVRALGMGDGWLCAEPTILAHGKNHNKELKYTVKVVTNPSLSLPSNTITAPAQIGENVTETWTNKSYLLEDVICIKNGATLTIQSTTIHSTPAAQIIIESGGKLIVKGGVFMDICSAVTELPIIVQNGGYMEMQNGGSGNDNVFTSTNININAGGSICFKAGSKTTFINKSTITIADGGYICVENGAKITLQHQNSRINILKGAFQCVGSASICDREGIIGNGQVYCECIPLTNSELTFLSSQSITDNYGIKYEIRIKNNSTVTFTGSTLRFGKGAGVVIEPGSKLILDGCTLTSACEDEMWGGITNNGKVELRGNTIIENASIGIDSWDGQVQANNAQFINNQQAILFGYSSNKNDFKNCKFIMDNTANFSDPSILVNLSNVSDISFTDCIFADNRPKNSRNDYSTGISACYSKIKVGNASSFKKGACTFLGLDKAIKIDGNKENSSQIYFAVFDNNHTGIEVIGTNGVEIGDCKFQIPSYSHFLNNIYYHYNESNMGIYLNKSSVFSVKNNKFTGNGSGGSSIGLVVKGSGGTNHFVKNNTFENLCTGAYVMECNCNDKQSEGLVFICNNFSNNYRDISIACDAHIRRIQSGEKSTDNATGNKFLGGSNWNIVLRNDSYIGVYPFEYYHLNPSNTSNPHYPDTNTKISLPYYTGYYYPPDLIGKNNDDCESRYGYVENTYFPHETDSYEQILADNDARYIEALAVYEDKDDDDSGGHTIDWNDPIVRDIVAMLAKHPVEKFTITINGNPPITNLEKQIVKYYELTNLKQYMDILCYDALHILSNNEEDINMEQYRSWVGRFNTIESEYLLAETYMTFGEFAQAETILNAIPSKFKNLDLESHQNYKDFCAVLQEYSAMGIGAKVPLHLAKEIYRLSAYNNVAGIRANSFGNQHIDGWMAAQQEPNTGSKGCSGGCGSHNVVPVCDINSSIPYNSPPENTSIKEKSNNTANDQIKIQPNPTTGELRVTSSELRTLSIVEVYDIVGKLQKSESRKQNGEIVVDISHLAAGLYFLTITDENKVKVTKKVLKE